MVKKCIAYMTMYFNPIFLLYINSIMKKLPVLFLLVFLLCPFAVESRDADSDSLFFLNHAEDFEAYRGLPMGELVVRCASFFLAKPYVASTLEKGDEEELVVNLNEFDCTTLVETAVALAGTIKSGECSLPLFRYILQFIRYRDGAIDGYSSRLHYVTDWIDNNVKAEVITNMTDSLGGIKIAKSIDFMTTHTDSYKQLMNREEMVDKMREIESEINERGTYSYIPKKDISRIAGKIKDGDIIAFATSIDGLDYSHMGIAFHDGGRLTFIHASTRTKTVTVEKQTLIDYCMKSTRCTGISVLRVRE